MSPHPSLIVSKQETLWRRTLVALGIAIILVCAFRAISRVTDGDFKLHWEFGRRFLAGEFLYAGGMHIPYPPFWAMAHAPAALLPLPIAKAILFPLGVGALVLLLHILRRLTGEAFKIEPVQWFWIGTLALFLASRYVVRDMAELGVNTALVALSWLGIYLWRQQRDLLGGLSLGMAVALKCTPAIFVAYFLWKRQWRMVAATGVAALVFTLLPILWQGPTSYRHHIETWAGNVWNGFGGSNPSTGVLGPEQLQNMSLRPALARYLTHLPPGHPGRAAHPLYFDVLNMPAAAAGWTIKVILVALLVTMAWWTRRPVLARDDPELLWEFAAVSIVMLLFSPITWGQHCVALLPACYFVSALLIARRSLPRWMLVLLSAYVLFVPLLSRDLVGRNNSLLLQSYHVETFVILGLLAVIFGCRRLSPSRATLPAQS